MTSPTFSLHGKVGLVTGAGKGIGKAIALALAEAGADVIAVARTGSEIEATAQEARALGCRAEAIEADVSNPNDVAAMARRALESFERIDIVVNNAAASFFQPLVPLPGYDPPSELPAFRTPTTDEAWEATLATNLSGPFYVLRALGPQMLERRNGRVINVSSVTPIRLNRFNSAYDAAKGGLISFTRSMAKEWARYGVTVNSIAPGQFYTSASAAMHDDPKAREQMLKRIPMRRTGDAREIGALAVYLASDAASFVTGQVIVVDGGESL